MKPFGIIFDIIIYAFALFGAFACFGGIRQAVINRRSQSRIDKDIQRFQKLQRQFNTKKTSNGNRGGATA